MQLRDLIQTDNEGRFFTRGVRNCLFIKKQKKK